MVCTGTRNSFTFSKMPGTLSFKAEATGNGKMETRMARFFSTIRKPGSSYLELNSD